MEYLQEGWLANRFSKRPWFVNLIQSNIPNQQQNVEPWQPVSGITGCEALRVKLGDSKAANLMLPVAQPVSVFRNAALLFGSIFALSGCLGSDAPVALNLGSVNDAQTSNIIPPATVELGGTVLNGANQGTDAVAPVESASASTVPVPALSPKKVAVLPTELPTETATSTDTPAVLAVASTTASTSAANTVIEQNTQTQIETPRPTATIQPSDGTASEPAVVELASLPQEPAASEPFIKPEPEKGGLLQRLFEAKKARDARKKTATKPRKQNKQPYSGRGEDGAGRIASAHRTAKKKRTTSSKRKKLAFSRASGDGEFLPGVKSSNELFGINRGKKNSRDTGATRVAAVGGLGRLSPNGLRVQHAKVQVSCLKPGVLRILKTVERRFGSKPIITSGYRSAKRNRRAGGARNSLHIYCKAVDIQVEGVSKWQLAKYLRTIPGRGGVGTYCRTKSVHLDIGSKRDWHHPCRRSKAKKRKRA